MIEKQVTINSIEEAVAALGLTEAIRPLLRSTSNNGLIAHAIVCDSWAGFGNSLSFIVEVTEEKGAGPFETKINFGIRKDFERNLKKLQEAVNESIKAIAKKEEKKDEKCTKKVARRSKKSVTKRNDSGV